tara:strand:+ start:496 stop:729 length:234 start_codon:yes stop_codon:yes gene_type:complete
MGAWHAALKNLSRIQTVEIYAVCSCENSQGIVGSGRARQGDGYSANVFNAYQELQKKGWTYDEEGNWICPECKVDND